MNVNTTNSFTPTNVTVFNKTIISRFNNSCTMIKIIKSVPLDFFGYPMKKPMVVSKSSSFHVNCKFLLPLDNLKHAGALNWVFFQSIVQRESLKSLLGALFNKYILSLMHTSIKIGVKVNTHHTPTPFH